MRTTNLTTPRTPLPLTKEPVVDPTAATTNPMILDIPIIRHVFPQMKLKDRDGRQAKTIKNDAGGYIVVSSINICKVRGSNNEVVVEFIMPDPKFIEVVKIKKSEEEGIDKG